MISALNGMPDSAPASKQASVIRAAQDFEALLIAQLLRSARETSGGAESDSMMEMAEGQFASILSGNGGLGLASLIAKSFEAPTQPPRPTHPQE